MISPMHKRSPASIATPRLLLRSHGRGDAARFAAAVRESAESIGRWMPWAHAGYSSAEALAWFAVCATARREGRAFEFLVIDTDGRTVLGAAGLNRIDPLHRSANLGYWVRDSQRGRGIATEAARALIRHGLENLGLVRIEIVVAQGNQASAKVARKAGAALEWLAPNRLIVGDRPVPAWIFAATPRPTVTLPKPQRLALPRRLRVLLRDVQPGDAHAFLAAARASRSLHHPWLEAPCTPSQFSTLLARTAQSDQHTLLVCRRNDGALVGVIRISNIVRGAFRSGYLSYYVFAGHERQGLMREAMELAVRHAFGKLHLHRVEANIQPSNAASRALVRACGFSLEGWSPRYLKINGRWRDHERWARLAD